MCQLGVKIFQVSNGCKNILGVKWEENNLGVKLLKKKNIWHHMGGKKFQVSNGCKNILCVK